MFLQKRYPDVSTGFEGSGWCSAVHLAQMRNAHIAIVTPTGTTDSCSLERISTFESRCIYYVQQFVAHFDFDHIAMLFSVPLF